MFKHKIKIAKEIYNFQDQRKDCLDISESIFIPAFTSGTIQNYFLIDFQKNEVMEWYVDFSDVIDDFTEQAKKFDNLKSYPRSCTTLKEYISTIFFAHSAEYHGNWIFVSFYCTNFILMLNIHDDSFDILYDEKAPTKLFSSTNQIYHDRLYFSRWEIDAGFHRLNAPDYLNDLEIGYFDLKTKQIHIIDTIKGKDEIHQTSITDDGKYILILEERNEPKITFPPISQANADELSRIYSNGLKKSLFVLYRLKDGFYQTLDLDNHPAHIEFDIEDQHRFYIVEHNIFIANGNVYLFGPATIDVLKIENEQLSYCHKIKVQDLYRCPSHKMTLHDSKKIMLLPCYPGKFLIVNTIDGQILKTITLSKNTEKVDFNTGPFKLPHVFFDRTPYTIHASDKTPYSFLNSLWNIAIYDYESDKKIFNLVYNKKGYPLIAMGHASKFILKN